MGKIVVIGFDGATFDIINPMIAQGKMKNTARLLKKGASGKLNSVIPPLSSPAWNSFATGKNPAKHGVYDFSKRVSYSYSSVPTTSLDRGARTMWDYSSDAGKKNCIVNVPLTYPAERVNGVLISGFPYPENRRDFAYPKDILEEVKENLGITSILKPNPQFLKEGDEKRIVDRLNEITRLETRLLKYLMKKDAWDLVVGVYDASDVIGHFFWHYIDPTHPKYDSRKAKIYGPMFYDVYEQLDLALGDLLTVITEDDTLFVISDHGFGPVHDCTYINNWLIKNGYMKLKRNPGTAFRKGLFDMGFTAQSVLKIVKSLGLVNTKTDTYSKSSKKISMAKKLTLSTDDIDWNRTRAYSSGNYGPIFVNLKGREPQGIVNRGEEYDNLVSEIEEKLKAFNEPKTGRQLFDLIYTKDKIYSGAFYETAPDLIYFDSTWLNYPARVFEFGRNELIGPHPFYSGAHRMEGIFIANGPAVARMKNLEFGLTDMAPTIMHMLGLGAPIDMDGRVLLEIFDEDSDYRSRPILTMDSSSHDPIKSVAQNVGKISKRKL